MLFVLVLILQVFQKSIVHGFAKNRQVLPAGFLFDIPCASIERVGKKPAHAISNAGQDHD